MTTSPTVSVRGEAIVMAEPELATLTISIDAQGSDRQSTMDLLSGRSGAVNDLVTRFSYAADPEHVVIDMTDAHVFDASTVAALDGIEQRFAQHGSTVEVVNLNTGSIALHGRLSGHLG